MDCLHAGSPERLLNVVSIWGEIHDSPWPSLPPSRQHKVPTPARQLEDQAKDDAVAEITGLRSERLVLALLVHDDRCVGTGLFAAHGENPFADWLDRRVCVRSWRGTFDSGWTLPWEDMDEEMYGEIWYVGRGRGWPPVWRRRTRTLGYTAQSFDRTLDPQEGR